MTIFNKISNVPYELKWYWLKLSDGKLIMEQIESK